MCGFDWVPTKAGSSDNMTTAAPIGTLPSKVRSVAVRRKPNSVRADCAGDHFSGIRIAANLKQPTREVLVASGRCSSLFGLAAGGVCHAVRVTTNAVRSYRTISPLLGNKDEG